MTYPPLPGSAYVITVSTPADFHKKRAQSRFHLTFTEAHGIQWLFDLKNPLKFGTKTMMKIEAYPHNPDSPLNVEKESNITLCRFLDANGKKDKDWLIATILPDHTQETLIPFWPPWKKEIETGR